MKDEYVQQVNEAVDFIKRKIGDQSFIPKVAITLGSGLGKLAQLIKPLATIPYQDIPQFPVTTVPGHEGTMIIGHLENVPVIGLKGRKHYYEVAHETNTMDIITFPVQVVANLGCSMYIATCAVGGLNPTFNVGDLM